jgi:DNA-binding response OmpR family regulator
MKRILIVEDNADLAFGLRNSLEIASYEVVVCERRAVGIARGANGFARSHYPRPHVAGHGRLPVLRAVREGGSQVPVLILTARGEEADKVTGFRLGADDYVTKPFGVLELVARVEAVLRRASASASPKAPSADASRFGDIEIQPVARVVRKNGRPVELSPKEYELLLALVQRPGQVISRC